VIPFGSAAAELCLNTALKLNPFGAHHCASISQSRAVRVDQIIVSGILCLWGFLSLCRTGLRCGRDSSSEMADRKDDQAKIKVSG
jgi:hypothetical protein